MNFLFSCFFFFFTSFLFSIDYDCVFVGSSPIPLFEAIYQSYLGNKVLVLEQASECGGAWKSINICGIPHADMGCHDVTWGNKELSDFFEIYAGCQIISFHHPQNQTQSHAGNYWFSKGCYELIQNILNIISQTSIDLRLNSRLDHVSFDPAEDCVIITTQGTRYSTKKIYTTPLSSFAIDQFSPPQNKHKYYHLYLLIADPTPPKFVCSYLGNNVSRVMNLTYSTDLLNSGRQLIVLQTHGEDDFQQGQKFLDLIKSKNLVDQSAYLLKTEPYIYEASYGSSHIQALPQHKKNYFETLNTGSLGGMHSYISKWKKVLKPYKELRS